jgi:hypothetical protein
MNSYDVARALYRSVDRFFLARLPMRLEWRIRSALLALARRLFPGRIQARSAGELAAGSIARKQGRSLPAWAIAEVRELATLEPALQSLLDDTVEVEAYVIPWDATYVGRRFAEARRQLGTGAAWGSFVLMGSNPAPDPERLAALAKPLAIIDTSDEAAAGPLAAGLQARYIWLRAEHLDQNDHCAIIAKLVLQCAPREVAYAPGGVTGACIERHGLAIRSVSVTRELSGGSS